MKLKKKIVFLLVVVLFLGCMPAYATQENTLKIERAVLINDTQVVIEFSEPIAFNFHQKNRGPHIAIRLIDSHGYMIKHTRCEVTDAYYNRNMQWNGSHQFVDDQHDRIIWTIADGNLGMKNIKEILNMSGRLEPYKGKNRVVIVIEEVPYDTNVTYTDNAICNVTTDDGKHYLTPLMPAGWERTNTPLTIDYTYHVMPSKFESVERDANMPNPLSMGDGRFELESETKVDESGPNLVVKNNPAIATGIIIGGIVLASAMAIVIVWLKKRKAASI